MTTKAYIETNGEFEKYTWFEYSDTVTGNSSEETQYQRRNFRIGKKQKLSLLTEDGQQVAMFQKGEELLAEFVCHLLNEIHPHFAKDSILYFVKQS